MSLRIPKRYRPGLIDLALLDDDTYAEFERTVGQLAPSQSHLTLATAAESLLQGIGKKRLEQIFDTLTSLFRLSVQSRNELSQTIEDVLKAFLEMASENEKLAADKLQSRLESLLKLQALDVLEPKARELREDFERLLLEAKVYTDARPVFGDSADDFPRSLLITHSMKLALFDKGLPANQHRELHFALDAKDISKLIETLKRAQNKEHILRDMFLQAGMPILELSEQDDLSD